MTGTQRKFEAPSAKADMPTYMRKDEYGYRFLRPIPKDLAARFGKANFVHRLGKDYKKAKLLCAELTVQTNREIEAALSASTTADSLDAYLKLPLSKRIKKITFSPELASQLASLWLYALKGDAQARQEGLEDEEYSALEDNITEMLPRLNRALATGQVSAFHTAVNDLLVGRGYQLEASDDEWQKLTYEVLKHTRQGYKILAARQQGEVLEEPDLSTLPAPLPAVWESMQCTTAKPSIKYLKDITPHYKDHLKDADSKSQSTYLSIWQRFVDFAPKQRLDEVSSADVFNFLKSRLQAAEKPWSYAYASGRAKRVLQDAFGLAKTLKLIESNPVTELEVLPRISAKEEKLRQKPRFPYTGAQLNLLFSSEWYNPRSQLWRGKMRDDLGARYWIPLICMWQGFRVSEAAQLHVQDIDLEHLCIKIQDGEIDLGPARTLKNEATKRVVPIHNALIQQGFTDFIKLVQHNYLSGPLFPSALPEQYGIAPKWGRAYEQSFLRFMRDTLGLGNGYGNHSFRHSLEDKIRDSNADSPWPEGLARAYTGRSSTRTQDKALMREEGSEKHYGQGYTPDALRRYIDKISYPEVSPPPTFNTWLDGKDYVSSQLLGFMHRWANG